MNLVNLNDPKNSLECMKIIRKFNQENKDYAEYSPDLVYRYVLKRNLQKHPRRWIKPILFIMLNPSTATEMQNDPTVRRCVSFAEREGATQLIVVNLFALRSTDPKKLEKHQDPAGPLNKEKIEEMIEHVRFYGGTIVAAWGASASARGLGAELTLKYGPFQCLGETKHGAPRHPLYVPSKQLLVEYK